MAKFTPGAIVGQISGSIGGTTYSYNRYGPYMRRRAVPVTSTTPAAIAAKARLTTATQAWQSLTAANKLAWNSWTLTNPVTNSLGQPQVLTGHVAFVGLATRLLLLGSPIANTPPLLAAPAPFTSISLVADIGAGDVALTFAPTPTGAVEKVWIRAAIITSPGIKYVQNQLRFIFASGLAEASPLDIETEVVARLGALGVGNTLFVEASVAYQDNGQLSAPLATSAVVIST